MMKMEKVVRFCPRCNAPYSYLERRNKNGHIYVYAVHYSRENGKRKFVKCYLGAEEYENVAKMHPEMMKGLTGMHDNNRYIDYLEDVIDAVLKRKLDEEEKAMVINILENGLKRLREEQNVTISE